MALGDAPPGRPTLTWINWYALVHAVVSSLRRNRVLEQQSAHPSLLVLSSFSPRGMHVKFMATVSRNLCPCISVHRFSERESFSTNMKKYPLLFENLAWGSTHSSSVSQCQLIRMLSTGGYSRYFTKEE
ncbi:hypothetical protein HPG69_007367 [Diceros bicornis minor]|uniref:Uncharacterized protein n=1 Tax=Diceros bicornis minor TaxID=77932 RepID=A0A7J7ELI9_DICBM|nr:hypothetical protein HPG69_007367 [Diceros bicornis minor]